MAFTKILDMFEKQKGWVNFQIESFNNFVNFGMQGIINEIKEIKLNPEMGEFKLQFGKVTIGSPHIKEADGSLRSKERGSTVFPNETRTRNLTYAAPVWVMITPVIGGAQDKPENVYIGDLPVMIKSCLCSTCGMGSEELIERGEDPRDPGGYFIINGTERVLALIEEIASNKAIFEKDGAGITVRINSEKSGFKQRHIIDRKPDGEIAISFANIRRLSIITLLKALGMETDRDICNAISLDPRILNELYINLYQEEATTTKEAIEVMGKKLRVAEDYREERVNQILDRYLLPHVGQKKEDRIAKAKVLAKIIKRLILLSMNEIPEDDIDHYSNKRLLISGELIGQLFRSIMLGRWGLLAKMSYNYQKLIKRGKKPTIQGIVEADAVTKQILSSLATGNWIGGRTGVSQRLDRSSYVKTISHLRSIISPLTSTQEHFRARQIHPTEFGRLDPAETPEGSSIGLRKHLAMMAEITPGVSPNEEEKILQMLERKDDDTDKKTEKAHGGEENAKADAYFNGRFVMETRNPMVLVNNIRNKRRMGLVNYQVNAAYHPGSKEVMITAEYGRVRRPVIIVENGKSRLTPVIVKKLEDGKVDWNWLVEHGIVEYLDANEEESCYIAMDEKSLTASHTHMEIDPVTMFGTSSVLIPYPEYNRGDRINYGAKMVGQSIGLSAANFLIRMDTKFNILSYPQSPIVETSMKRVLNEYPEGQNVVIAIMCHDGFNLNDAVVINKSSVDRGLFRSFYFRTYETIKKRYYGGGQEDEIRVPEPGIKGYRGEEAYKNLAEDGIINPEIPVHSDSILVGKVSPLRFLSGEDFTADIENRRESSVVVRYGEKGTVDTVVISETTDANQMIKIRIRDYRIPELGDKFASRHGQKGVTSLLVPHEDMPFTKEGIVPDVIFNPHAIPSRMTIGHMLEMLAGKTGALAGKKFGASAFNHVKEDEIRQLMSSMGFRDDGKTVMYNGKTGEKYEVLIFSGLSYYMKLDHMVSDKIHARSRGPVTLLTKQPTEGRAKRGGLRLGEMEQQCLVGHGAVLTLKERFDSDKTVIPICKKCGLIVTYDTAKDRASCPICKECEIAWIETGHAFRLFVDELKSLGIYPKIITEEI